MKAIVDEETCISCGLCPDLCPQVFEYAENGKARAKVDIVPSEFEGDCRSAADQCPVQAIAIEG
jgi:ferredoxin